GGVGPFLSSWAMALLPSRSLQARTRPNRQINPPTAIHAYWVLRVSILAPLLKAGGRQVRETVRVLPWVITPPRPISDRGVLGRFRPPRRSQLGAAGARVVAHLLLAGHDRLARQRLPRRASAERLFDETVLKGVKTNQGDSSARPHAPGQNAEQ